MPQLQFAKSESNRDTHPPGEPWRMLIVDDESEVHSVTELSLRDLRFAGRPIEILHAYSGAEARRVVAATPDIHLVLLDVVMESDDAGLRFVEYVRDEMGDRAMRIVLRTGQPGLAPESEIIHRYDINDYRLKTDLTHQKLMTMVVAALRGHTELVRESQAAAVAAQDRLQRVLDATGAVARVGAGHVFFATLLRQVADLLGAKATGLVCAPGVTDSPDMVTILAGLGSLPQEADRAAAILKRIGGVLKRRESLFEADAAILYIQSPISRELVVYCETSREIDQSERLLLGLFAASAGVSFDNLEMIEEMLAANITLEDRVDLRTRELVAETERLRTILDECPAAIIMVAPETGRTNFINAAFAVMMGAEPATALNVSLEARFAGPDDALRYRNALQDPGSSAWETRLIGASGAAMPVLLAIGAKPISVGSQRAIWLYPVSPPRC